MPAATAHPCPLTIIAWRLGGLTLTDLWLRHLALGGTGSRTVIADYLDGVATLSAAAHNVLAQTLNEGLWELRIPSLVPLREPEQSPRGPAPHTGPGQPDTTDRRR